jgi:hypothetical protein
MSSEQAIQNRIRLDLGARPDVRLWRNNTGAVKTETGQLLRFGLCVGSSDLIGLRTVTVTPEMVGTKLAVFTAIEVKTPKGRPTEDQARFLSAVTALGGLAGVARSTDCAKGILGLP